MTSTHCHRWPPCCLMEGDPAAGWVIGWHPKLPCCGIPLSSPREADVLCLQPAAPGMAGIQGAGPVLLLWDPRTLRGEAGCTLPSPNAPSRSTQQSKRSRGCRETEQPLHAWPAARDYCSQMGTVRPCQPQIHSKSAPSAFLECVAALASPSAALHSITCQVPSVSPRAKNLSPTYGLCTRALCLSKYLSWTRRGIFSLG